MTKKEMKRMFAIAAAVAAMAVVSLRAGAQDAKAVPDAKTAIDAAAAAMGTAGLQSIQYTGTGAIFPTGQAYQPGGPWPRYTVKKYTMLVNFAAPAMRQELVTHRR